MYAETRTVKNAINVREKFCIGFARKTTTTISKFPNVFTKLLQKNLFPLKQSSVPKVQLHPQILLPLLFLRGLLHPQILLSFLYLRGLLRSQILLSLLFLRGLLHPQILLSLLFLRGLLHPRILLSLLFLRILLCPPSLLSLLFLRKHDDRVIATRRIDFFLYDIRICVGILFGAVKILPSGPLPYYNDMP